MNPLPTGEGHIGSGDVSSRASLFRSTRLFEGWTFLITGMRGVDTLEELKEKITSCGGKLESLDDLVKGVLSNPMRAEHIVVLSDKVRRTAKYLFSLCCGHPPLHFSVIDHCVSTTVRLDDISTHEFALDLGRVGRSNSLVGAHVSRSMKGVPPIHRPVCFEGIALSFVGPSKFTTLFARFARLCGASSCMEYSVKGSVVRGKPHKTYGEKLHSDYIVLEQSLTEDERERTALLHSLPQHLSKSKVGCTKWFLECLIKGKRVRVSSSFFGD